jgi:hypothetical protein
MRKDEVKAIASPIRGFTNLILPFTVPRSSFLVHIRRVARF